MSGWDDSRLGIGIIGKFFYLDIWCLGWDGLKVGWVLLGSLSGAFFRGFLMGFGFFIVEFGF